MNKRTLGTRCGFSTKPLVAAVAMALLAPAAFADNGMPGAGLVVRNVGNVTVNSIPLPGGNQIIGLSNGATIQSTYVQNTVIQWGSPAVLDTANKAGFNLASGKTLNFTSTAPMGVLNIDISGAMSNVNGNIVADANTIVVIANEKGINVGGGTITAPFGFELVGGNMNTIDAINAFANPGAALQMNFAGSSPVTVTGVDLSGVGAQLLVAGSGVVNLSPGKAPAAGVPIYVVGGVGSDYAQFGSVTANDKGAPSTTVRSSAATDVTIGLGTAAAARDATTLAVWANGNLTNTGNLDFKAAAVESVLQWTGKLTNTGTLSTTTALTPLDLQFNGDTTLWYNNGATNAKFAQGGLTNSGTISAPDGFLNILLDAGAIDNSGTLSAKNYLQVETLSKGGIVNSGTATSATSSVFVLAGDGDVTNSGTMTGAGFVSLKADSILAANPHQATNSGKLVSTGSTVQMFSEFGGVTNTASGSISATSAYFWANNGAGALPGHNTNAGTISITAPGGEVGFYNFGAGDITVGGTVAATGAGSYLRYFSAEHDFNAAGSTIINTPITVLANKFDTGIYLSGNTIVVNAPLTVLEGAVATKPGSTPAALPTGAGEIEFYGVDLPGNSTTINADLVAGNFYFWTGNKLGNPTYDMNVRLNGDLTTTAGGWRTVEMYSVRNVTGPGMITANSVLFDTSGNVNNPVSKNYLENGLNITTVDANPVITINARAPGIQTVNLDVTGDVTVTSGQTVIAQNPCYSGLCTSPSGGYVPQSNAGSSLLIQATGNLTIGANNVPGAYYYGDGGSHNGCEGRSGASAECGPPQRTSATPLDLMSGTGGLSASNGFLFPGALAFVSGATLNVNAIVDNAFTGTAAPFQGIFFEGQSINALLPIYTNGNSFVNYSVRPNGGVGLATVYNAKAGTNFLGFPVLTAVLNPLGSYLNTYTVLANAVANGEPWLPLVNTTPFTQ